MWHSFRKFDQFCDRIVPQLILLLIFVVLRLPNFCEPYWYGDEGIYLTIGQSLRYGERLYLEIIDHKTPLIYYLAMVPNQFWFRVLNFVTTLVSAALFYHLTQKLFKRHHVASFLSTLLFILLTSLPAFEGHIPNGELFVMFFILIGATIFSRTSLFMQFFGEKETHPHVKNETKWLLWSGVFFSLGILTKVPGLFDVLAFLSLSWFTVTQTVLAKRQFNLKTLLAEKPVKETLLLVAGVITPIILSILYYILRGSGKAYLDYGLLYNFRYAGSWQPEFSHPIFVTLFTLQAKALILAVWLFILTVWQKKLHPVFTFIATWFGLALFAALLSNRPYPHYFLQVVPSLSLLLGFLVMMWKQRASGWMMGVKYLQIAASGGMVALFIGTLIVLNVGLYRTREYYGRFWQLTTGQISKEEYRNSFNDIMTDNYAASELIRAAGDRNMLIWGTNPMLYAQTHTSPPGRFTVLFHIRDFKAEQETIADTKRVKPTFIVVMKCEEVPSELSSFLYQNYLPNNNFEHFTLWKML